MRNAAELAVTPGHDKYDDDHDQYDDCDDDGEVDIGDVWVNLVLEWHIWYLELGTPKYSVTFTHCKLNEVDIGDVEALC